MVSAFATRARLDTVDYGVPDRTPPIPLLRRKSVSPIIVDKRRLAEMIAGVTGRGGAVARLPTARFIRHLDSLVEEEVARQASREIVLLRARRARRAHARAAALAVVLVALAGAAFGLVRPRAQRGAVESARTVIVSVLAHARGGE